MLMATDGPATRGERLKEEMYKYALISAYLFVCFAVILLYEASQSDASSNQTLPFSLALVKALVMGKFILIGEALSVGSRADAHPLLHRTVWKTLAMLILLIVFKIIEELIVGWFHGVMPAQVAEEFLAHTWIQMVAPPLLMLLVLIPLISATELYRALGKEKFRSLLSES
jgi:uncharacterized membrane protein YjfL (UPF0719 family)